MTGGAGSEPSRGGGEALVFCTAQYKYLLRREGLGADGGLEQRDGAPPGKWTHHPTARSERWEHKAQPSPGCGAGSGSPRSSTAAEPPGPSAPLLRALGGSGGSTSRR